MLSVLQCYHLLQLTDCILIFFIIGFGVMKKCSLSVFIDHLFVCAHACLIQLLAIEASSSS